MATEVKVRVVTTEKAWLALASDVLLMAIKDARQKRNPIKQEKARSWLVSPAGKMFFEAFDFDVDVDEWVKAGCPILDRQ